MGIEIPRDVAASEGVPDDLDSTQSGPYRFPSPRRRRVAGVVYLIGALLAAIGVLAGLPVGLWVITAGLGTIAIYHFITAWPVTIDESQALAIAGRGVSFPVGHATAAVRFDGALSKPTWNVIVYSADDPPTERGLVRIDATNGNLRGDVYTEAIPPA